MLSNFEDFSNLLTKECPICCEEYDCKIKKPLVMDCGHTICIICLRLILNFQKQCPFDKLSLLKPTIESYPVNWTYLEILNSN
jgi:hypothetical protein